MKKYQFHNLISILLLLLCSISFLSSVTIPVHAYEPFGVVTPLGSSIQIFTNPEGCDQNYGDQPYLGYGGAIVSTVIETSSFCVYISNPDNQTHHLIIDMYASQTLAFPQWDPATHGYITVNQTSYTKLISSLPLNVTNDHNLYKISGFSTYLIDKNIWAPLASQLQKVQLVVHYDGLTENLFFKTSFSNEPFTTTYGNIFVQAVIVLFVVIFLFSFFFMIFNKLARRWGNLFPQYPLSVIGLAVMILILFSMVLYATMKDAIYQAYNTLGWTLLAGIFLIITFISAFIATGYSANKSLYRVEVIEVKDVPFINRAKQRKEFMKKQAQMRLQATLDMQDINTKIPIWEVPTTEDADISRRPKFISHTYYQYIHNGRKRYLANANSLGELIARMFNGGINLNFKNAEIIEGGPINEFDDQYTKEYIFCESFDEIEKGIWGQEIDLPFLPAFKVTSLIYALLLVTLISTFALAVTITNNLFNWIIDVIIFFLALAILLGMYLIKSSGYMYEVRIIPLAQNVAMVAFSMMRMYLAEQENKDLLRDLEDNQLKLDTVRRDEWMRSQLRWNAERYPDNIKQDINPQLHEAIIKSNSYNDDLNGNPYPKIERLTKKFREDRRNQSSN